MDSQENESAPHCLVCTGLRPGCADLWCASCHGWFNRACVGTPATTFIGGSFKCPGCELRAAGLASSPNNYALALSAIRLKAKVLQPSSLVTYWSGIRRFERFWKGVSHSNEPRLRPGPASPLPAEALSLFITWARSRYAPATILSTVSAIRRWHNEKGIVFPSSDTGLNDLLRFVEKQAKAGAGKTPKTP